MSTPNPQQAIMDRMQKDHAPDLLIASFLRQVEQLQTGSTGFIAEAELERVPDIPSLQDTQAFAGAGRMALGQTLILKLNGGLGTSMGLDRAKSLLPVKNGLSFLDLIARQLLHLRKTGPQATPLLLMNSSATHADTLSALHGHPELESGQPGLPPCFVQHRVPKLDAETLRPVRWPANPDLEWCPPGHGDLYLALVTTGSLRRLLDHGYRYAFISNADNLGATLDEGILGYVAEQRLPFLMEVTRRTEADRKGGHLARRRAGGLLLREGAQCPREELDLFQDIQRHRYFNTNNIWLSLDALDRLLRARDHRLDLPLIINRKPVDPQNPRSPAVLQLETAMGAALSAFPGAAALDVPRRRFSPVKTTNDLLALWSDAYQLTPEQHVTLDRARHGRPPVVELDPRFYLLLPDFQARFPTGAPSLLACESLRVEGDIRFDRSVVLRGRLHLANRSHHQITLSGTTLDSQTGTAIELDQS